MKRALLLATAASSLALLACGGSTLGRTCTEKSDCAAGQSCYTSVPGGYCTKGCAAEGTSKDCPSGSVCALNAGQLLCSTVCASKSDCREELECASVQGSTLLACTSLTR